MRILAGLPLMLLLIAGDAVAGDTAVCAEKDDILVTGRVTAVTHLPIHSFGLVAPGPARYRMAYESKPFTRGGNESIRVRVWDRTWKSWPGIQPQIIQIVDNANRVLNAKEVGGEPMMREAWTAQCRGPRLFVYVRCDHRRGDPPGTYIYEIGADNSVAEKGIYFSPDELASNETKREAVSRPVWEGSPSTGDSR